MNKGSLIWLLSIISVIAFTITNFIHVSGQNMSSGFIFLGLWIIIIIITLSLMFIIYKDAKEKGLNENYWVLILLFNVVGAIIYWFISKNKKSQ